MKNAALHKKSSETSLVKGFVEGEEWSVRGYERVGGDPSAGAG